MRFESPQRNDNFSSNETKRSEIDGVVRAEIENFGQKNLRFTLKKSSRQVPVETNIFNRYSIKEERRSHQNYSINSNKNHQFWTFIFLFVKFSASSTLSIRSKRKNKTSILSDYGRSHQKKTITLKCQLQHDDRSNRSVSFIIVLIWYLMIHVSCLQTPNKRVTRTK